MNRWLVMLGSVLLLVGTTHADSDLNVVVILDNSGSMETQMARSESRMEAAKRSLLAVLKLTPPDANVGVILLNPQELNDYWLIPLGPIDRGQTRQAIRNIRAGGPTQLGGAMKLAADALMERRATQKYGQYKLLLVTDGEATDQREVDLYLPEIQSRGLLTDVIGVDMGQQHSLATRASTYRNAADPASLEKAISAVVLGESSYDDMDAGETDFELLEGLPIELAATAVTALTSPLNTPIGGGDFQPAIPTQKPAAQGGGGGPGPASPPVAVDQDGGFRVPWFMLLIMVFFVMRLVGGVKKKMR